jgi:hypothetical protein
LAAGDGRKGVGGGNTANGLEACASPAHLYGAAEGLLARRKVGGCELSVKANDVFVLVKEGLIGGQESGIVKIAEGLKSRQRRFNHGDIFGSQNCIEDLENEGSNEDGIFVELFDESC